MLDIKLKIIKDKILSRITPYRAAFFTFGAICLVLNFFSSTAPLPQAMPEPSVDANGNLTMAFPLDIPEGTGGMTPQISLSYHSQGGSASMGKGWVLSGLPEIRRDADLYSYKEQKYSHSYNGSLLLHNGSGNYGFRSENFARLEPQGNPTNPASWIERSPDGNWKLYGDGSDHTIASMDSAENWVWAIKSEQDVLGNAIQYEYYKNDGNLLPKEIIYANGRRTIEFSYEDFNDDKISFVLRNQRKETKILSRIAFYTEGSISHSYDFTYDIDNSRKVFSLNSILYKGDSFTNTHIPISFQKTAKPRGFLDHFGTQNVQANGYGTLVDTVDRLFELVKQILFQKMMSQVQAGAKRGNMSSFDRANTATFNGFLESMGGMQAFIPTAQGTSASRTVARFPKNIQSGLKRSIAPSTSLGEIYLNVAHDSVTNPIPDSSREFQNFSTEGVARIPIKERQSCDLGVIACICAAVVPGCHAEVISYCANFVFLGGFDSCQNGITAPVAMAIPTDINGDGIMEYSRLLGRMDSSMALHVHDELGLFGDTVLPDLPIRYNTYMDVADIDGDGRTDFVYASGGKLHVAFSEGTYFASPVFFNHVNVKNMPLNFTRVDEYKPSDFLMDWNRDGRTDFIHVDRQFVHVYLSTGRNFAPAKTYNLDLYSLEHIEIVTKDESPTGEHRLSGFADMDGDGILEHVMVRPNQVSGFNSTLEQIRAENKLELEQKQAEFAPQKNQLLGILANPSAYSGGQIAETRSHLQESDRETYDQFIAGDIAMDSALEQTFITSFETFFVGPKIENILEGQIKRLKDEENRLAGLNIQFNSFVAVVTYFSPNGVVVRQESQDINTLGLAGMNWLLDVNGDGLPDLVSLTNHLSKANPYSVNSIINEILKLMDVELVVRLNEGGKFSSSATVSTINSQFSQNSGGYQLADVNLDGEVDFLVPTGAHGRDYDVYLGNGLGNFTHLSGIKLSLPIDADVKSLRMEDRNGDGVPDMHIQYGREFKTRVVTSARDYPEGLITQITDGNGGSTQINYSWKKDMPGTVVESNRSYVNGVPNYGAQVLVQSVTTQASPDLAVSTKSFQYSNQRYKMGDEITSANLGFETVTETHSLNGTTEAVVTTRYSQNPNYAGTVSWQEVRDSQNVLVSRTDMSYAIYYPTAISKLILPTTTTSQSYVNGQLKDTKTTTTTYNSNYSYSPATVTLNWNGRITTQETYYASEPGLGILAEPIEEITSINGELVSHVTRSFANGNITSESKLVEPGKWYAQYFTYDTLGNVITQTDSLGRTLQYTYGGTNGNLPITATNAIGQTTSKTYDPITDLEIESTDANGNITTVSYDKYGRTTESSFNGNRVQSVYYEYIGNKLTTSTVAHSSSGDSWTRTITDKEGKTRLTESLVTTGITSTEETKYDNKGRAIQKSHAYLTGETPTWTTTEYYPVNEDNLQRPKRITANTGEITDIIYTLNSTQITMSKDGEVIRTETAVSDNFGQLQSKTVQGNTIQYGYNNKGQLVQVIDPGSSNTTMTYDLGGRKLTQSDQNSGTVSYTYNLAGEMVTQTDARGITQTFTTDGLGRITKVEASGGSFGSEPATIYTYDTPNSISNSNTIGKLTKIADSSGITEIAYDSRGQAIVEKRTIDDLTLFFQRTYDELGRMKTFTYPEGTKIENVYLPSGQMTTILIHAHDGSYSNQPVVQYYGPIEEDGKLIVRRKTGNKVEMDIEYDRLRQRPNAIQTRLGDGHLEQKIAYEYDNKGNISKITDHMNESRNQEFEYDNINRITRAVGKYGEETYNYNQNGNLTKRGKFNLQYNNPSHAHAVTQANSIETGAINYSYDSIGNLTNRNGDMYRYDSKSKLREITTAGGDVFTYSYDHTGQRIKKYLKNADTTTYSFGNIYEVHRSPGVPERHTLFITGISGDLVSQYTRPDANLLNQVAINNSLSEQNDQDIAYAIITSYNDVKRDLTLVWDGIPSFQILREGYTVVAPVKLFLWIGLLLLVIYIAINISSDIKVSARFASAIALVPFLFINIYSCSPLFYGGASGEEGVPPWLLGLGIPADTQSVNSPTNTSGGGGGGNASQATARIPGMFFMHPDHLGSITMLTDGYGNVLAGGEMGGKSHITYKPYGEILRTDSYGPDVSKYKYTGQEEDMESGLYYYKARYYDPAMGRFTQNDSLSFPGKIQGMNRMMYVEGNPIRFTDSSGNNKHIHMFNRIIGHAMGKDFGAKGINKFGKNISIGINRAVLKGSMWASDRLSIRRHVKYIAREMTEKIVGHRNDRIKNYTKDFLRSKWKSLENKAITGQEFTDEDFRINSEDFFEGLIQSEIFYQAALTFGSNLGGDILTNIKDNPFDIFDYYQRVRKMEKQRKQVKGYQFLSRIVEGLTAEDR